MEDPARAGRPAIRISDADRERVCARLRDAFAEGRLTPEEFEERTAAALSARTQAELVPLTVDLPAPAPVPERRVARSPRRRELRRIWTAWASMAVVLNVVWLLTVITSSTFQPYWPVWPLGITGALGVVRTLNLRGSDDDQPAGRTDAAGSEGSAGHPRGHQDRRRAR